MRESFIPYGAPPPEPSFTEIDSMGAYPKNPLLSKEELGETQDLRYLIPEETQKQLTDDEQVVRVNDLNIQTRLKPPSNLRTLMALTGVTSLSEVGDHGPAIAALPGSKDISDAAQNRFIAPHIRDAILTAKLRMPTGIDNKPDRRLRFPKLMRATLLYTAEEGGIIEEQYHEDTPYRQERPGKAMLVNFGLKDPGGRKFSRYLGWGHPIYTSVDATPLFITETADYVRQEEPDFLEQRYMARDGQEHLLGQFFDASVDRIVEDLDSSKDGFLEFKNLDPRGGMPNQSWSDSAGAYVHSNGEWANHNDGIAAVEVQGYAYDALMKAAVLYREKFNEPVKATRLEGRARQLQRDFLDKFFTSDKRGTYAVMGRDYDDNQNGRQLEVRHANMGLLLETGILDGDNPEIVSKREAIIDTLFSEGMITKYGIRTLDSHEAAYRPGGDHVGQIWPHINESIARGLIKYGYHQLANYLRRANLLIYRETNAMPEYIRGDSVAQVKENHQEIVVWNSRYKRMYMFEIPGQRSQAWSNEAVLAAKYDYPNIKNTDQTKVPSLENEHEKRILATLPEQAISA